MNKTKILLGLTATLAILAITATSATAKWVGTATTGTSINTPGSRALLSVDPGSATPLESSKTPDTWRIQDSKKEQNVTKEGAHLDQEIDFENLHITVSGTIVPVGLNNPITIQLIDNGPGVPPTALISKEAIVKIVLSATKACTITLEPATNTNLNGITLTKVEAEKGTEIHANTTNITSIDKTEAECAALGITPGKEGQFKALSIEKGVKQV
jgi:hypothetical protein